MRQLISFIQSFQTEGLRPLALQASVSQGLHSELVVRVGSKISRQVEFLRYWGGNQLVILNKLIADRADIRRQFGWGQPSDSHWVSVNLPRVWWGDGWSCWRGWNQFFQLLTDGYHYNGMFTCYILFYVNYIYYIPWRPCKVSLAKVLKSTVTKVFTLREGIFKCP